jgi:CubicO group peptidase (beta-lactamase class C family)
MSRSTLHAVQIILLFILVGCTPKLDEASYNYQTPTMTKDDWEVSSLVEQNIEPSPIIQMVRQIKSGQYDGVSSVVLARRGTLVLDEYFGEGSRETIHTTRSASKAITSALVGIAIDQGFVASVNVPLLPYFPEYKDKIDNWDDRKADINLAHILSMTSGVKGNEDAMYPTDDWIKFYLDQPLANIPGEKFSYATSGVVTLGSVISRSSGMSVPEFANRYLFGPLGITEYFWPGTSSKGDQGLAMTGGGLKLKSRDMAKFGQLYLDKGLWKGRRVISESWINLSIEKHSTSDLYGDDFGFLWRMIDRTVQGRKIRSFEAWGNGGQFIMIFPSLELVAVFTGENYGRFPEMEQPFEMIEKYVLSAMH